MKKLIAATIAPITLTSGLTLAPPANAANQNIHGSVTCINFWQQRQRPDGIWVDTNTRDGWASFSNPTGWLAPAGSWTAIYNFDADNAGKFTLHIGCGGTQQKWGPQTVMGPYGAGVHNLEIHY